jgi:hypothetical protein
MGEGADAVAYDASRGLVFSSNGENGSMTMFPSRRQIALSRSRIVRPSRVLERFARDAANGGIYMVAASLGRKPPATKDNPEARPPVLPGSFVVFVLAC